MATAGGCRGSWLDFLDTVVRAETSPVSSQASHDNLFSQQWLLILLQKSITFVGATLVVMVGKTCHASKDFFS